MVASERIFNLLFGMSVLTWGVLGIQDSVDARELGTVRLCIAALHAVVAVCLLTRKPVKEAGSAKSVVCSLPSLVVCLAAFTLAQPPHTWHVAAQLLFISGTLLTLSAFIWLGRSFAILPALRDIVTSGPYRFIRHPAYLGELLMVVGCLLALAPLIAACLALFVGGSLVVRINAEERLLSGSEDYRRYAHQVSWRMLPGIW